MTRRYAQTAEGAALRYPSEVRTVAVSRTVSCSVARQHFTALQTTAPALVPRAAPAT
ncbi:hypothetical protein [Streptomyces sioyaensis]|uniref:hypothetical protein n=1 Tax=Streptomyces sioyaensis TaxID=67364 RepID=UPI003D74EF98